MELVWHLEFVFVIHFGMEPTAMNHSVNQNAITDIVLTIFVNVTKVGQEIIVKRQNVIHTVEMETVQHLIYVSAKKDGQEMFAIFQFVIFVIMEYVFHQIIVLVGLVGKENHVIQQFVRLIATMVIAFLLLMFVIVKKVGKDRIVTNQYVIQSVTTVNVLIKSVIVGLVGMVNHVTSQSVWLNVLMEIVQYPIYVCAMISGQERIALSPFVHQDVTMVIATKLISVSVLMDGLVNYVTR